MAILDADTLSAMLNQSPSQTPAGPYLDSVIADATDSIARYLNYDPTLGLVQGEEGLVTFCESGNYAGRYLLELARRPLLPGPAATIFSSLQLTYGYAALLPTTAPVSLANITVQHNTGFCYALAGAGIDALTAYTFASVSTRGVRATGYTASYVAGYATGIGDPTPNGGGTGFAATATLDGNGGIASVAITTGGSGYTNAPLLVVSSGNAVLQAAIDSHGSVASVAVLQGGSGYSMPPTISVSTATSFNAPSLPASIRQAAALLCRERIAFDAAANADSASVFGGITTSRRTEDQADTFAPLSANGSGALGLGGPMSMQAERKLAPYRRMILPLFL